MNKGRSRLVPVLRGSLVAGAASLGAGCLGPPDIDTNSDRLVVTEAPGPDARTSPRLERGAAIAEMRAKAAAGEAMPFPDVYQAEQTTRLAARPEPKPLDEVAVLEAELAGIAQRLRGTSQAGEIAALKQREAELRRLLAAAQGGADRPGGRMDAIALPE